MSLNLYNQFQGFPGGASGKESTCPCRRRKRRRFDLWVGSRKWQPIPVFLSEKLYGQRSLVGYSPWGCQESNTTGQLRMEKWLAQNQIYTSLQPGAVCKHFSEMMFCHWIKFHAYHEVLLVLSRTEPERCQKAPSTSAVQTPLSRFFPHVMQKLQEEAEPGRREVGCRVKQAWVHLSERGPGCGTTCH